ncbi:MAG: CooT family nickel-binding protein [Thermodesulfobacteriota bacterium]|nr:CooT family nickel-binding protein [Thermodesulfobacteriota bacterium]
MCEANVYLLKDGKEELVLESVDIIEPEDGEVFIKNIFGEQKVFKSKINRISLINHKILLENLD